jgi:hypothetical protein
MIATSRAKAIDAGCKRYFTGRPCKHGHVAERYATGGCVLCIATNHAVWRRLHPGKMAAYRKSWVKRNPDKMAALVASWAKRNPGKTTASKAKWRKLNPGTAAAGYAAQRSARLLRSPKWADRGAILSVFKEAKRLTAETGILHNVDHEIPLQGRLVSGLHVHTNLRAIPAAVNARKHNKFEVAA